MVNGDVSEVVSGFEVMVVSANSAFPSWFEDENWGFGNDEGRKG